MVPVNTLASWPLPQSQQKASLRTTWFTACDSQKQLRAKVKRPGNTLVVVLRSVLQNTPHL